MNEQKTAEKRYFWVSFALMLLANRIAFLGSRLLTQNRSHYSLAIPADSAVPFLPWTIIIYIGCFAFWFLLFRLIARLPRERADRFFCANLIGHIVCFLFFAFFPTVITRPTVNGASFWDGCVRLLYYFDAPNDLFPSVHCMIGWLCWAGVRGNTKVPLPWRAAAAIMAVFVCVSTLTVRQHVLLDVFAGILLGEICYWLSGISTVRGLYSRLVDRLISL